MKKQLIIFSIVMLAAAGAMCRAQSRQAFSPETIYRPVYGYVIDSLTSKPMPEVMVYGFDSPEDAEKGREALLHSRNPLTVKVKGDVVETSTDATGRYMLPVLSRGALVFYFKDTRKIVVEEVAGRNSISLGRQEEDEAFTFDLSGYEARPARVRSHTPSGVRMGLDFNYHFPNRGEDRKNCRIIVKRMLTDVETGEVLSYHVPVVRDGRGYRRMKRKSSEQADTLLDVAKRFKPLVDSTSVVNIKDSVNTENWKGLCFSLDYVVILDNAGEIRSLDTLHIMTNRTDRPLKYLDCRFEPYSWIPEEPVENNRKPVRRKLVIEGKYTGYIPGVLKDPAYTLAGLNVKAVAAPERTYTEDMAEADARMQAALDDLKRQLSEKVDSSVRIIKTTEVLAWTKIADMLESDGAGDTAERIRKVVGRNPGEVDVQTLEIASMPEYTDVVLPCLRNGETVEYRLEFNTLQRFSRSEYLGLLSYADDDREKEEICLQALEEAAILEKSSWDYAASTLASVYIRRGQADTVLLSSFISPDADEEPRPELVANQVMMLMLAGDHAAASSLSARLPSDYGHLKEVSACLAGGVPSGAEGIDVIRRSSVRNDVLMDMFERTVDGNTLEKVRTMAQDDAMRWYLEARCLCLICGDDVSGSRQEIRNCLVKCFALDDGFRKTASLDSGINEHVLKEVLGVFVL